MKKKITLFVLFCIILLSCNSNLKKDDLELVILSDKLNAFCADSDGNICNPEWRSDKPDYDSISNSTLRFKILNRSKYNYMINSFYFFSKIKQGKASLNILSIQENETKKVLEIRESFLHGNWKEPLYFNDYKKNGYASLGYLWIDRNRVIAETNIKIAAGETIFFETHLNIPVNKTRFLIEGVKLNKDKKYSATLKLKCDTTNIKKHLTWSQLKNIEENNYKLFNGTIISENSVPIEFVD